MADRRVFIRPTFRSAELRERNACHRPRERTACSSPTAVHRPDGGTTNWWISHKYCSKFPMSSPNGGGDQLDQRLGESPVRDVFIGKRARPGRRGCGGLYDVAGAGETRSDSFSTALAAAAQHPSFTGIDEPPRGGARISCQPTLRNTSILDLRQLGKRLLDFNEESRIHQTLHLKPMRSSASRSLS